MTSSTFIAGRGFLYRLDPRAKTLLLFLLVVWCFLPVKMAGLGFLLLLLLSLSLYSVGRKATRKVFLSILPMLVFMVVFMPFSQRGGKPLLTLGDEFVLVTREGALQTLLLSLRFSTITYSCTLVLSTSRMHEVMSSLRWYRLPFKAILVITLAFTYIPFVADSFREISDSHKLRQASDSKGRNRLKDMIPTLTSALVVSLRSIPFLAMSLEERGYGRDNKRSRYHDLSSFRHPLRDFLLVIVFPTILFFCFR